MIYILEEKDYNYLKETIETCFNVNSFENFSICLKILSNLETLDYTEK